LVPKSWFPMQRHPLIIQWQKIPARTIWELYRQVILQKSLF
jgi:hypothetical protein